MVNILRFLGWFSFYSVLCPLFILQLLLNLLLNVLFRFDVISVNGHVAAVKMETAKENQGRIVRKVENMRLFHVNCRWTNSYLIL